MPDYATIINRRMDRIMQAIKPLGLEPGIPALTILYRSGSPIFFNREADIHRGNAYAGHVKFYGDPSKQENIVELFLHYSAGYNPHVTSGDAAFPRVYDGPELVQHPHERWEHIFRGFERHLKINAGSLWYGKSYEHAFDGSGTVAVRLSANPYSTEDVDRLESAASYLQAMLED